MPGVLLTNAMQVTNGFRIKVDNREKCIDAEGIDWKWR